MIRYLIKNNIKIMLRNPVNIFLFILCPIVISAVLISAFSSLLESYECSDNYDVGYMVTEGSPYENYIDSIKEIGEKNGVKFIEYSDADITRERTQLMKMKKKTLRIRSIIENNNLCGFVEIDNDSYKVYKTEERKAKAQSLNTWSRHFLIICL